MGAATAFLPTPTSTPSLSLSLYPNLRYVASRADRTLLDLSRLSGGGDTGVGKGKGGGAPPPGVITWLLRRVPGLRQVCSSEIDMNLWPGGVQSTTPTPRPPTPALL